MHVRHRPFKLKRMAHARKTGSKWVTVLVLLLVILCTTISCTDEPPSAVVQQIAYLWFDSSDTQQLYLTDSTGIEPHQISSGTDSVLDFAPSPDGGQIIYSQMFDAENTVLMLADIADLTPTTILTCKQTVCKNPIWSKDNRRVIYEKRDELGQQPRLYWIDTVTGQTIPVFSSEVTAYNAQLSPDESHITFVYIPQGKNEPEIAIFTFETGNQLQLPNLMNAPVEWHPTENRFLFFDMEFYGEKFGIHMFTMNVNEEERRAPVDLSQELIVEDSSADWSADGKRIVFGRKQAGVNMGSQMWTMDADGENAEQLTSDHDIHHGSPEWSADGRHILHQQFNLAEAWATPSLWLYDVETGTSTQISSNGSQPRYIP